VELIEAGKTRSPEMRKLLMGFLQPMLEQRIDCLVLGCTHYPYLIPVLKELLPNNVTIIDSGEAVARQTKAVLQAHQLLSIDGKDTMHRFYTNKGTEVLKNLVNGLNVQVSYLNF
jgi:glutamate racemase